ncbi:hypothetical protein RO3G_11136 [Lichtheimia corymbifera JMRC:FSU:9682]|uniref:N-acetyltransferase domain-containing protein n=1 Tax=Lichtheimia corymbifera JMRC:FSU:9682 TaxID=1263082 RepID=A0A068SEX1_9FUNG|nr:hypothetical protein RO3G_11136 [Lichtheimia corymbifera JMRC:FSU:9682]
MVVPVNNNSSPFHVRQVTSDDLKHVGKIVEIINGAFVADNTWTSVRHLGMKNRVNYAEVEDLVRNKILLCVFDENQVVVATAEIQPINSDEAGIGLVSVDPARQSQGIGKLLLLATIDKIKEMGYKVATMSILGERPELLAWYAKLGFQDTGERPLYRNPAVIEAVLPLTVVKKNLS